MLNFKNHSPIIIVFLFLSMFIIALAQAQAMISPKKEYTQRATALCPEISKLAEAIALARDTGQGLQTTMYIIQRTIELKPHEVDFINKLSLRVYEQRNLTPYTHSQVVEEECYQSIQ